MRRLIELLTNPEVILCLHFLYRDLILGGQVVNAIEELARAAPRGEIVLIVPGQASDGDYTSAPKEGAHTHHSTLSGCGVALSD